MSEDTLRIADFAIRVLTLLIATFGGVEDPSRTSGVEPPTASAAPRDACQLRWREHRVAQRHGQARGCHRTCLSVHQHGGPGGAHAVLHSLGAWAEAPLKLEDGESFTVAEGVQDGDRIEVSLDCFLGGRVFQWAATVEGQLSARNTYATISKQTLTDLKSLDKS